MKQAKIEKAERQLAETRRRTRELEAKFRARIGAEGALESRRISAETAKERWALVQERQRLERLRDELGRVDAETWVAKRRELLEGREPTAA